MWRCERFNFDFESKLINEIFEIIVFQFDGPMMYIRVKYRDGRHIFILAHEKWEIYRLIEIIQCELGLAGNQWVLKFNGEFLVSLE
jgi:hypothetical protein